MSGKQDRFSQKWYQRTLRDKIDRGANLYNQKKDQQDQLKPVKHLAPKPADLMQYHEYKTVIKKLAENQWIVDEFDWHWNDKEVNTVTLTYTVSTNFRFDSFYGGTLSKPPSRVVDSIET